MEDQAGNRTNIVEYIRLISKPSRRIPVMLLTGLPGFVLLIASFLANPESMELILLRLLNALAAIGVLYYSLQEYNKPGSVKWITQNAVRVITGFLILSQAAADYKIVPELQYTHLLFLIGGVIIFKEVMFRDEKNIPGFEIHRHQLVIRSGNVKQPVEINSKDIKSISLNDDLLLKFHFEKSVMEFRLSEYQNAAEAVEKLKDAVRSIDKL